VFVTRRTVSLLFTTFETNQLTEVDPHADNIWSAAANRVFRVGGGGGALINFCRRRRVIFAGGGGAARRCAASV